MDSPHAWDRPWKFAGLTLEPRHLRGVLVAGALVWAVTVYVRAVWTGDPRPSLHGAGLAVVVLNLAGAALLGGGLRLTHGRRCGREAGRRDAVGVVLLVATLVLALVLYGLASRGGVGVMPGMVALWALAWLLPVARAIALGIAVIIALGATGGLTRHGGPEYGLLVAAGGVCLGAVASRARKNAEEATRRAEAATAVLDERSRIAREIHDVLAHSLSAQIVHLEGARLLLARDDGREQALDRVERAQRLARAGLEETRRALATLRGDAPPPEEALAELAEEFRAATGRECAVTVSGAPRELSPQAGLAVVRTAQEALTNVRRHAPGARVHVVLHYGEEVTVLQVTDSGGAGPPPEPGGGYGLVGMRERAELIGGTLETGPEGKGYRVSLRVPA
ncbi:sensor histidine kinase [Actinomadura macrotermitis]|uniref:histidine kinase n=1 Tax=Actinomadura macrotermitis TaxID=2585200 RepID=A0A7K0C5C2_9ACTN|nr:histidine kinase [Actinomadura macrotermitis]MQY08322.1 hypothetical protein [Actinomadura macrotermitis]